MPYVKILQQTLSAYAGIDPDNFDLSAANWKVRNFSKGEFYNEHRQVCKYLGFITSGVFRSYYADEHTGDEKNVFFFSENQVIVAFKSFITQTPCNYHTQAMTDAHVLYIHIDDLKALYKKSHQWECFGRLLAEQAFHVSMQRTESFLFKTAEQRYTDLIEQHPKIFQTIPLYHISSYLGIQGPSLSRIRKRLVGR